MNEKQTIYDWNLGWQWLVSSAVGTAVLGLAAFASMWSVGETVEAAAGITLGALVTGGLFGALFALGANIGPGWLLHRRQLNGRRWVLNSIVAGLVGAAAGFAIAFTFFDSLPDFAGALFLALFLGLPVSLVQSRTLQQQGVSAPTWPLIGTSAYLLALLIGISLGGEGREWISLGTTGLILGAITGLGMMRTMGRKAAAA